jgi:preprotein translocase subunit SecA
MVKNVMGTFKIPEDEPIQSGMISKSLETAQKRIEGFNFDSRKQVLAYDDVLNSQRLSIYQKRRTALLGTNDEVEANIKSLIAGDASAEAAFEAKRAEFGEAFPHVLRRLLLQVVDAFWLEHLETMEYLRRSVSLRAYGQRDPLIEYRREGLIRFNAMESAVNASLAEALPRIRPADDSRIKAEEAKVRKTVLAAGATESSGTPLQKGQTPGRNDTVTIRNGDRTETMKYKKAEPYLAEGWELI